jgi:hypothetical protein
MLAGCLACGASGAIAQVSPGGAELRRMHELSHDLTTSYLQLWSTSNQAALADVGQIYASRIRFYGKAVDRRTLWNEKRRFTQRWPVRSYAHRPGTMRTDCDVAGRSCRVRAIIDWTASNPSRGAASRGSSLFELGIDFSGPQPLVQSETGQVVARR